MITLSVSLTFLYLEVPQIPNFLTVILHHLGKWLPFWPGVSSMYSVQMFLYTIQATWLWCSTFSFPAYLLSDPGLFLGPFCIALTLDLTWWGRSGPLFLWSEPVLTWSVFLCFPSAQPSLAIVPPTICWWCNLCRVFSSHSDICCSYIFYCLRQSLSASSLGAIFVMCSWSLDISSSLVSLMLTRT